MVQDELGDLAFQAFIGSIILFGVYIGTFFLLNQTGLITIDVNLFLEEFGLPFVIATVLWEPIEVGQRWLRS